MVEKRPPMLELKVVGDDVEMTQQTNRTNSSSIHTIAICFFLNGVYVHDAQFNTIQMP